MARIGFLADDLTGAADVLAQAHAHGLDAALSLDPSAPLPRAADVVGIAGPARSLQGEKLDRAIREGLAPFAGEDLDVLLYKVCSTFDSSPTVGSIGRAIELLHETWPEHGAVPVAPAQPEFGRYTAFSQHFGVYRGEVYRLDRHPVMSRHPSTPMSEADLRDILAEQLTSGARPGAVHLPAFTDGSFEDSWAQLRAGGEAFVVDAVEPAHMDEIAARLSRDAGLSIVIGAGGIMAALARVRGGATVAASAGATAGATAPSVASGPALAVSASASATTADQIADAVAAGWHEVGVPAEAFQQAEPEGHWVEEVAAALMHGQHVVAHTLRGADDPRMSTRLLSSADVGGAIGRLARIMAERDLTRDIAIFGGDSSSHALLAMGVTELRIREQFVTAGPICRVAATSAVADCRILLKGGQVGPVDILRRFVGARPPVKETP